MKKSVKTLVAAAVAGAMCFGSLALTACGSKEAPGKSAYEIAVENGFEGTEEEWLESLTVTTPGKSAYEIAVEEGFEGTKEEWLESLKVTTPGKTAYEIAVDNGFEGTEEEWLESLNIEVPTTVKSMTSSVSVNAKGQTVVTVTFTMSDNSVQSKEVVMPRRATSASLSQNIIMSSEEAEQFNSLTGLVWSVNYDDGSTGNLPVQKSQLLKVEPFKPYGSDPDPAEQPWDGTFEDGRLYRFDFIFSKNWYESGSVWVYICDDLTTIEEYKQGGGHGSDKNIHNSSQALQKNDRFDVNTIYLSESYELYEKISTEYDGQCPESYFCRCIPITSAMLDKAVDTSATGKEFYTVTYEEEEYNIYIAVYDPAVSVVSGLHSVSFDDLTLTEGDDLNDMVAEIVGTKMSVYYYVYVNASYQAEVEITEAMLDFDDVDTTTPGEYTATVTYEGYTEEIYVVVQPDMSAATKDHELTATGNVMTFFGAIAKIDLYSNGYCDVFVDRGSGAQSLEQYIPYTVESNELEVKYNGEGIAIAAVDLTANTLTAFAFDVENLTKTYTGTTSMFDGAAFTLKTYNNGYGELIVVMAPEQSVTFTVGYTVDDGVLTITPSEMGLSFTIGANDVLTEIEPS